MKDITDDEDFSIVIDFPPAERMRYDTLGDYHMSQGELIVQIRAEGSFMERMAILLHELAEWAIVHKEGIPIAKVDEWDLSHPDSEEPGDEPGCPYGKAHRVAMGVEEVFRSAAGLRPLGYREITDEEEALVESFNRGWEGKEYEERDSASKYLRGE